MHQTLDGLFGNQCGPIKITTDVGVRENIIKTQSDFAIYFLVKNFGSLASLIPASVLPTDQSMKHGFVSM